MAKPYRVAKTKFKGRPAELLTFTGSTESEYDEFLDARFADGREAIGFRTGASALYKKLVDASGKLVGGIVPCQFRRLVVEE